ncbi:hypothetical protein [Caballeronia grimmiae]|nr:hypothetical protein [Caballeronia grimmiae]GGD98204.1 hypothetical protein GCM10010985_61190 [Caballeronia grimmiae]
MDMQRAQAYQSRTADAENEIRDIVSVSRASPDEAIRRIQKGFASGVLHEWVETTDELGDAPASYSTDRGRLVALVNAAMLDA